MIMGSEFGAELLCGCDSADRGEEARYIVRPFPCCSEMGSNTHRITVLFRYVCLK